MKGSLFFTVGLFIIILFVACSSSDESANKLFVEASQLAESAEKLENTSYSDAYKLYKDALEKLEEIISKYPSSQLTVKLVQNEAKIGKYPINEFRDTIVPQAMMKANAEKNPLVCALLVAKTIKEPDERAEALAELVEIAVKYAGAGQQSNALKILSQALNDAKTIERHSLKDCALGEIAVKYAEVGEYEQALNAAKTIKKPWRKNYALGKIAVKYAEVGEYEQALNVVKTIKEPDEKAQALADIAVKCAETGQQSNALKIFSQALNAANTIKKPVEQARALADIAVKCAELGKYKGAFGVANAIEHPFFKNYALGEIAVKCAEVGEYKQALDVAKTINRPIDKAFVLCQIVYRYSGNEQKVKVDDKTIIFLREIIRDLDLGHYRQTN